MCGIPGMHEKDQGVCGQSLGREAIVRKKYIYYLKVRAAYKIIYVID